MSEKVDLDDKKLVGLSNHFIGATLTEELTHPLSREDIEKRHLSIIKGVDRENPGPQSVQIGVNGQARKALENLLAKIPTGHQTLMAKVLNSDEQTQEEFAYRLEAIELFEGGLQCYSKGLIPDAIKMFTRSIDKWSNDCRPYLFRGICHVLSDNPQDAEEDLKEAVIWSEEENERVKSVIKLNLAQFYFACSKCYADFKETSKQNEELAKAMDLVKEITTHDPEFEEARNIMQKHLQAGPESQK